MRICEFLTCVCLQVYSSASPLRLGPQRVELAFASDAASGCKPEFSQVELFDLLCQLADRPAANHRAVSVAWSHLSWFSAREFVFAGHSRKCRVMASVAQESAL